MTPRTYRCQVEVRGYELDSFGHVNHAVYISYLEHARWKIFEEEGITLARLREWGRFPVIAAIEARYKAPTFLGDRLDILTTVLEHGKTSFVIGHEIRKSTTDRPDQPVLDAKITVVMVNEQGRPSSLPEHVEVLWRESSAPRKT